MPSYGIVEDATGCRLRIHHFHLQRDDVGSYRFAVALLRDVYF